MKKVAPVRKKVRAAKTPPPPKPKRKNHTKAVAAGLLLVLFAAATAAGIQRVKSYVSRQLARDQLLQAVEIATDGTLPRPFVLSLLPLPPSVGLGAVDVAACRSALLQCPQIFDARVERRYPHTLRVMLRERSPYFRLRVKDSPLVVATDGTVFHCEGLTPESAHQLPLLDAPSTEQEKIPQIPDLIDAIQRARKCQPDIVSKWRIFSISGSANPLDFFEVRTPEIHQLRLGMEQLPRQLEELEFILSDARARHQLPLARIDLTIPGRAYVRPQRQH